MPNGKGSAETSGIGTDMGDSADDAITRAIEELELAGFGFIPFARSGRSAGFSSTFGGA